VEAAPGGVILSGMVYAAPVMGGFARLRRLGSPTLVAILVVLAGACEGGQGSSPSAATPATGTLGSTPETETPATRPARQFVYSTQVREVNDGRTWPTRAIVSFDPDTSSKYVLAEYGAVNDYPVKEVMSPQHLFYATENRLVRTAPDGSGPQEIFHRPQSGAAWIEDFDVSPDGSTVALVLSGQFGAPGSLVFIDASTGRELSQVPDTAPGFSGFVGYLWKVHWRDDGLGVVVSGGTSSERPGGTATVLLGGRVTVHDLEGYADLAPDGRHVADGPGAVCPMLVTGPLLRLRDLDSGPILSVSKPGRVFTQWAWSPNSDEFLFQERDWSPEAGCGSEVTWGVSSSQGTEEVRDLGQLFSRWYGDRLVELVCGADEGPSLTTVLPDRWTDRRRDCPSAVGELRLAGKPVDTVHDVFVLGFRSF
jgi:hypothetical protein